MKKSLFLRTLVFALAILMALGCAAGCKKDPNNNEGESTTTGEQGNNDNVGPVIPEGYIDVDITKYVIIVIRQKGFLIIYQGFIGAKKSIINGL